MAPDGAKLPRPPGSFAGFLPLVGRCYFLPVKGENMVPWVVIAVFVAASPLLKFVYCLWMTGGLFIYCWYAALQFNVLIDGASGEERIEVPAISDWISDVFIPGLYLWLSKLIVRLPAVAYLGSVFARDGIDLIEGIVMVIQVVVMDPAIPMLLLEPIDIGIYLGVLLIGHFFWPIVLLVIAVGGNPFDGLRFDLMGRTIVKTLPGYLFVVFCMYASLAVTTATYAVIYLVWGEGMTMLSGDFCAPVSAWLGATLLEVYLMVSVMRMIGVYYHHFKSKFAWSWG